MRYDRRILLLSIAAGLPGTVAALLLLWAGDYSTQTIVTVGFAIARVVGVRRFLAPAPHRVSTADDGESARGAARERFLVSSAGRTRDDPLGETLFEINALADTLRDERLGSLEATALLQNRDGRDRRGGVCVRRRAQAEAGESRRRAAAGPSGRTIDVEGPPTSISLAACLEGTAPRVLNIAFPGGTGQWQVRRGSFRQGGLPHTLVVLSDVNVPLRQQEREAWHRLIRVLGHELNNSLAPIKSIAGSLESIAAQDPMPADWRDDMRRGLGIIAGRTDALSRFTSAYTALARLPRPNMRAGRSVGARRARRAARDAKDHSGRARRRRCRAGRSRSARAAADQPDAQRR